MGEWLFKLCILWICLSSAIIASVWYFVVVIKPRYPKWWRRVIVDEEPRHR
jgi:hypothetical protein